MIAIVCQLIVSIFFLQPFFLIIELFSVEEIPFLNILILRLLLNTCAMTQQEAASSHTRWAEKEMDSQDHRLSDYWLYDYNQESLCCNTNFEL